MKKKINILLVVIWMIIIFMMSSFSSTESSNQSGFIVNIIANIFNTNNIDLLSLIIRKTAHFTEYFILGILVQNVVFIYKKKIYLGFMLCIVYAICDEVHQLFVPGRSCQFSDMLIDILGALLGIFILLFFNKIIKRN